MSKLIAVDNGHGINTPGKRTPKMPDGRVIKEWEFNYPTAKKLGEILRYNGFRVLYVSDTEEDRPLNTRTSKANNANADLFISIHYNAFQSVWGSHGGIETLYHPNSVKGKELASLVQNELIKETGLRDRGIKERPNLAVLRGTRMPSILAECGFMDNLEEANLMLNENYQWKCAKAIAKGACKYYGRTYRDLNTNVKPIKPSNPAQNSTQNKVWRNYINGRIVKDLQTELNRQFNRGLAIDGWFGQNTINALVNVRKGARGNLTRIIQRRLETKGYSTKYGSDGIFGNGTYNAVVRFQKANSLSMDGIVGCETWKALFRK